MRKIKKAFVVALAMVMTVCMTVPTFAASKKSAVDPTLAVPPAFSTSQYAILNPAIAVQYGNDITKMYNHYLTEGVRKGERIYATPLPMPMESLFLYMSYNRQDYIKKGLNATYPYFNVQNYIAQNPGLVALYGTNYALYLYHYVNFGIYEGKPSGSLTDPAKVITWNSAIASLNNAKLSPAKIISNYTATTGQMTTMLLTTPIKAPTQPTTPVYHNHSRHHEHDWKYESIDDEKHWKKCRDCDDKEKEDHHYHVYSVTNGTDTTKHVLKCSKCDHKYAQAHYDKNGDGKCDKCGYVITTPHTHVYGGWVWNNGTTTHTHRCVIAGCTVSETANCDHTSGGTCTGCGHVYTAPAHVHNFGTITWNNGTTTHTKTCTATGCTVPPYSFIEDCDHATGGTCSGCGHVYEAPGHTHVYGTPTWNSGTTTHTKVCTAAGCSTPPSSVTEDCDHTTGGTCSGCGHVYEAPTHNHHWSEWTWDGGTGHTRDCDVANCPDPHQSESCDTTTETCSKCGHEYAVNHTHTCSNWSSDGNGHHNGNCDNCGEPMSGSCDHDGSNGNCSACGFEWQ